MSAPIPMPSHPLPSRRSPMSLNAICSLQSLGLAGPYQRGWPRGGVRDLPLIVTPPRGDVQAKIEREVVKEPLRRAERLPSRKFKNSPARPDEWLFSHPLSVA